MPNSIPRNTAKKRWFATQNSRAPKKTARMIAVARTRSRFRQPTERRTRASCRPTERMAMLARACSTMLGRWVAAGTGVRCESHVAGLLAMHYDRSLLQQDYGWHVTNIFDTRIAAQLLGYTAFGLAALLERFFDIRLDKKHQRADWSMRPLTNDMLDYAAQDTRYLLELKDRMAAELARMGRMAWAREDFAQLECTRWPHQ